jgi:hypothetical protein
MRGKFSKFPFSANQANGPASRFDDDSVTDLSVKPSLPDIVALTTAIG